MSAKWAVALATIYLVIYTGLAVAGYDNQLVAALYLVSPLVIIAMVYFVLKDDGTKYGELAEGEEWAYRDKSKEKLGLF